MVQVDVPAEQAPHFGERLPPVEQIDERRGAPDEVSSFGVRLRAASRRYAGTEIVLTERFLERGDPACCGSIRKATLLRYSRARDRYVPYRATVRR